MFVVLCDLFVVGWLCAVCCLLFLVLVWFVVVVCCCVDVSCVLCVVCWCGVCSLYFVC